MQQQVMEEIVIISFKVNYDYLVPLPICGFYLRCIMRMLELLNILIDSILDNLTVSTSPYHFFLVCTQMV